jgi:putative transposase
LLDAAHQYLKADLVVIWDNLNTHISAAMRRLIAARDWLHIIRLPAYTPDLNPPNEPRFGHWLGTTDRPRPSVTSR